jgi:hypothetical protein
MGRPRLVRLVNGAVTVNEVKKVDFLLPALDIIAREPMFSTPVARPEPGKPCCDRGRKRSVTVRIIAHAAMRLLLALEQRERATEAQRTA